MAEVFGEGEGSTPSRMRALLEDERFRLFAAFVDGAPVGGLSAHVLPLTRLHGAELFIYDIAVVAGFQRHGIGKSLMQAAVADARQLGLIGSFVPAEADDSDALEFYRRIGGVEQAASIFGF